MSQACCSAGPPFRSWRTQVRVFSLPYSLDLSLEEIMTFSEMLISCFVWQTLPCSWSSVARPRRLSVVWSRRPPKANSPWSDGVYDSLRGVSNRALRAFVASVKKTAFNVLASVVPPLILVDIDGCACIDSSTAALTPMCPFFFFLAMTQNDACANHPWEPTGKPSYLHTWTAAPRVCAVPYRRVVLAV